MSTRLFIALVASVALSSAPTSAQSRSSEPPLTLRAAVAEAIEQNPDLRAIRAQYEAARIVPNQERFLAPPMLETQIWAWPLTTANPAKAEMYMFMAEQELPGRGKRAARIGVAERDAEIARQEISVRAVGLLAQVRTAFVNLAFARDQRGLYDAQRRLLQDMAEAATVRYAGGQGGQHHTVASLVDLARLEKERIAADERVGVAEARLNQLMGRPVGQLVEPLEMGVPTVHETTAVATATVRHADVAAADVQIAREEAELARLRGERRPDFVVGGGYMLMPGEAGAWTARAGVTWPNAPWSRGRLNVAIDAQSRRIEAAKAQRDAVITRIRHDIRQIAVRVEAAQRQVALIESTVLPQVEHAFELARVAYAGGEGEFTDVLESRRLLLTTQLELVEARADVSRAFADLESAVGLL
jgi:cobalt-zinc-cadmium efflux system outer membrane protein